MNYESSFWLQLAKSNLVRYFLLDIYKYIVNISNILSLTLTGFLQRCTSAICIEKVRRSFVYFIEIVFDILFFPFSCNYNNDNIFPVNYVYLSFLLAWQGIKFDFIERGILTSCFLNKISYHKVVICMEYSRISFLLHILSLIMCICYNTSGHPHH